MRIDRLRIDNFRRFRHVDVELGDGVTTLVGLNGAGKSTLLEAIGWCLFGQEAARTTKDLLKRRGAGPSEDVRVHLAFRFGPHAYEVTRELVGKSETHGAVVKVDGKVVVASGASSGKEATAYLARAFHMDAPAFFTSVVARQRELAALTDITPARRREILVGLLRLDAIDDAIKAGREQRSEARAKLDAYRGLVVDPAPLRASVEATRAQLAKDDETLAAFDVRIRAMTDELEELRAHRDSERKIAEEHRSVLHLIRGIDDALVRIRADRTRRAQELATCQAAGLEAEKLVSHLERIPEARLRVDALLARSVQHQELEKLRAELQRADLEIARAASELEEARQAIAGAAAVPRLAERLAAARPEKELALATVQRAIATSEAERKELSRRAAEFEEKERRVRAIGPESPCPTCTRPLHEHYDPLLHGFAADAAALRAQHDASSAPLAALRAQEKALREEIQGLAARDAELRLKLQKLASDETRAASASARHAEAAQRAGRLREREASLAGAPFDPRELDAARADLRGLEAQRERHARLCAEAERAPSLVALLAELDASETAAVAQKADAERRRDLLAFDPVAHDALESRVERADKALTEARIARERLVSERARRMDEKERLLERVRENERMIEAARASEARVRLLEELVGTNGLLPEFKDHLVARIRPVLSLHAGRLFRELTGGRYADLELDENYDLLVHDEGQAFPLERFSGGEADLANLCLRLAVSQVVAERAGNEGFAFLALDEIFGSQDDVRKGNILRALQALSGRFRQILLITHIPDVKDTAEHVLRVEALDDGTSRVLVES